MTDEEAIRCARREIVERSFEETSALLRIHEVAQENGQPQVVYADSKSIPERAFVYFKILGEPYHIAVVVDSHRDMGAEVCCVFVAAAVRALLTIESTTVTPEEMSAVIGLEPTRVYVPGKAARPRPGKLADTYEWLLEPQPEIPDDVESKLGGLLDAVAEAAPRIATLRDRCEIRVSVVYWGWAGNGQFGGWGVSPRMIEILHAMGASLEFDLYATGPKPAEE